MALIFHRIRTIAAGVVHPPSPSFLDSVFSGGHSDHATPTADRGATVKDGSRIGRLRPQRRDLAAALRADPAAPDDELTTWPAAGRRHEACQGC